MTPREKACKGVKRPFRGLGWVKCAKQINGVWRCTAKREPYKDKDVVRHRLPTCNNIEECKFRREDDDKGNTTADEISDPEETSVKD